MVKQNYAASHETVRISAKRYQRSPFTHRYATDDAIYGVYARRFYPLSLGADPEEQYWSLRRDVAMFDVPERPIEIEGRDAVALLERVFCRRISNLKPWRARYAVACAPTGGIVMDGVLIRFSEDRFWYVQADGEFDNWLKCHADGLTVQVRDPSGWVLQVQGPKSFALMQAATGGALDQGFGYFHAGLFDVGGQELLITRTGWTGELGYEIYARVGETDCDRLWDHLMRHGQPHGLIFSSLESMGIRRIEAGILDNGTDIDMSMTPFEAGLDAFVELDKDEFVGKPALMTAPKGPRLFGLTCKQDVPFAGLKVIEGNKAVGTLSSGAWSPHLDCGVGFVRFDAAGDWLGKALLLETREGSRRAAEVVGFPFYDRGKRIPRDLAANQR